MFTQHDILHRMMQAFGMWPTADLVTQQVPSETRELIAYHIHLLEGPHLLALLYLTSYLYLLQQTQD
jgi:hypothetical protein